jgi:hypothetical protein
MLPTFIGLFAFLALVLIIGTLFAATVASLLVNGVILYLLVIRMLKEINKGWLKEYGWGALIAFVALYFTGFSFGILWAVTTFVLFWFVAAQLVHVMKKK